MSKTTSDIVVEVLVEKVKTQADNILFLEGEYGKSNAEELKAYCENNELKVSLTAKDARIAELKKIALGQLVRIAKLKGEVEVLNNRKRGGYLECGECSGKASDKLHQANLKMRRLRAWIKRSNCCTTSEGAVMTCRNCGRTVEYLLASFDKKETARGRK